MSTSGKSPTNGSLKPVNIFYIWYSELCRRLNITPLTAVKPARPKNDSVLDFVADRIKPEDWVPIISALRQDTSLHVIAIRSKIECKFLHEVDTEEKLKCMKRKFGSLWTAYVLNLLVKSLSCCIKRTEVLTCLELEGLPIFNEYLEPLLDGLTKNKTIRLLALTHFPLGDYGCQQLCMCLRFMPNVEVLNLSACHLGTASAEYLAKLIRYQQLNRYCESWHSSLRYEDPDVGIMAGLKRITLNNNPLIGDEGLALILNELDDDLWIKAIDMQRCGITNNVANRLIDVIDYSRSLEIADFRNNENLSEHTIEKIFNILKDKQSLGFESEFQWCLSTTSTYEGSQGSGNVSCVTSTIQKSKSTPFKQSDKPMPDGFKMRRTKTFISVNKKSNGKFEKFNQKDINIARKEVLELNAKLQEEISKRVESEIAKKELEKKIEKIKKEGSCIKKGNRSKSPEIDRKIKVLEEGEIERLKKNRENSTEKKKVLEVKIPLNEDTTKKVNLGYDYGRRKLNGINGVRLNGTKKPVEFVFPTNGTKLAQQMFENFVSKNRDRSDLDEDEEVLKAYCEDDYSRKKINSVSILQRIDEDEFESESNASLLHFVQGLRNNHEDNPSKDSSSKEKPQNGYKKDGKQVRSVSNHIQKVLVKVPPVR